MSTLLVLDGNGDPKYISYASGTGSSGDPLIPNDETRLASILAKLSADPASQTTLAAILAKIIAAPATEAKQDALAVLIGEVSATPTSNTLLDRLKAIHTDLVATLTISGTVTANIGTVGTLATAAKQDTGNTSVASIDTKLTDVATQTTLAALNTKVPALGQAVAGSSTPVVLPAVQITTLTPPAAIIGFATETTLAAQSAKLPAVLGQTTKAASLSVALASNQDALPITDNAGSLTVDNAGTFATQSAQSGTWTVQPGNTANTTPWLVKEVKSATPTQASVASSASNVTVLAANANRLGATIYNDSTAILYLKLGATATNALYSVQMAASSYFEVPFGYTGIIDGIWASANGNARVTELAV